MSLNQGQELHQRYRIVNLIGQGGFGAVYRAWDLTLKRPCAVKENQDTSAEAQKQFDREVQLLSNLHHSNLPRIYDFFFLPGMGQYLVMDFIEGQNLQTMLETRGPLPEAEVVPWMRQICDALAYMHSQNPPVIHRDIKPANIIITPQGRAVLVDFGISKIYDTHLKTTVGARAVTPGFSPWEQYGQGTTDNRSDIYAMGATLYVLLTGQEPPESIALMGGMATLTPPHQINRAITPHVAQVIEHAMQTRPTERFAAAAALGQALLQYTPAVSTSPTPSSPTPSPQYPSQPSPSALPGWVLGVGGILLLVIVLVIGISLGRNQNNTSVAENTTITATSRSDLIVNAETPTVTGASDQDSLTAVVLAALEATVAPSPTTIRPSATPRPTNVPTHTPTVTPLPTTIRPSATPRPTNVPSHTPSRTPTKTPQPTSTPLPTATTQVSIVQNPTLLSGQVTIFDGFTNYGQSGFRFSTNSVVAWDSNAADILAAKSSSMNFFIPYDAPPFNNPDTDKDARSGIIVMQQTEMNQVSECPASGYTYHWVAANLGSVYCVRTRNGEQYAVIKLTSIGNNSLSFTWEYQPDGSRRFH